MMHESGSMKNMELLLRYAKEQDGRCMKIFYYGLMRITNERVEQGT
jgi:hypothetical protein